MKVAIVGAGIGGLSLAWALTRRGVGVTLFEAGPVPNPRASSNDEHRMTRHCYGTLGGYGALMPDAFRAYEELWSDLRARHFRPTKFLYLTREASTWHAATARDLDRLGIAHRTLTSAEVRDIAPMLTTDAILDAFEADGAGELFAARIIADLARWLGEAGVDIRAHTRVRRVDAAAGRVETDTGLEAADVVVVAAGAWVLDLLPGQKGRLVPSRQTVLYLAPPPRFEAAWARAPVILDGSGTRGTYILPPAAGTRLKLGDHSFTRRGQGDDDRIATPADIEPVEAAARDSLVDFDDYRILEAKVCYYTVTADERFVVEPIGGAGWLMSACSGHGFKLAPLIAGGLADAIIGRRSAEEIPAWAAARG